MKLIVTFRTVGLQTPYKHGAGTKKARREASLLIIQKQIGLG
jgi:hypothetical protein